MKEEQLIKDLKLLKKIQPSGSALKAIKHDVYQRVRDEQELQTAFGWRKVLATILPLRKSYKFTLYAAALVTCLMLFSAISYVIFPYQLHTVFLNTRLAVAPNHYAKARIAFADLTQRFADGGVTSTNTQELSRSLSLTNKELSNLKLKGESGKYTAGECQQLYREYHTFLEDQQRRLPGNDPAFSPLKAQISSFEEQAEKKLNMYHSL